MKKLTLGTVLLLAGCCLVRAETIELTGLANLFGDKLALLVLYQPAQPAPVNLTLSEGQSQYGVKLLSIDEVKQRVQIEISGVKQYVDLDANADLSGSAPAVKETVGGPGSGRKLTPQEQWELDRFLTQNEEVQKIRAGTPVYNSGASSADNGNSGGASDGSDNQTGSTTGGSGGSAGSSTPNYTQQYWYSESLAIEQNRLATAEEVAVGSSTPLPLTPLTPSGTPAALISKDALFSNHIPGYVETGSVNAWDTPEN